MSVDRTEAPPAPADVVLSMHGVSRTYGSGVTTVTALAGVDLAVTRGELVAIMGPSGSGKSTLLHVAGGLDRPDFGDVLVEGLSLTRLDVTRTAALRRRSVGFVFQDLNLVGTLTLEENVALPLELDGVRRSQAAAAARLALDRVGIGALRSRFPDDVSGGQRQRAAIARALVGDRHLVLADEPTGALDTATGDEVMSVLRGAVDEGCAAVVVTHDSRVAAWADRVVFMRDGAIVDSTGPVGATPTWESLRATPDEGDDADDLHDGALEDVR